MKRVVLAVTFLWLVGCEQEIVSDKQTSARPVRLWSVTASQSHPPMQFVGEVAPARTVDLGFEVDGTLKALPIREGEVLQAGTLSLSWTPVASSLLWKAHSRITNSPAKRSNE